MSEAADHKKSGSKWSMVACYRKGSRRIIGRNQNKIPGHLRFKHYPWFMGQHCEAAVLQQSNSLNQKIKGGTFYIVGTKKNLKASHIRTTRPCQFCAELIIEHMEPRFIVFFEDNELVKMTFREYIDYHETAEYKECA